MLWRTQITAVSLARSSFAEATSPLQEANIQDCKNVTVIVSFAMARSHRRRKGTKHAGLVMVAAEERK